ncbi:strigolactone esterase D14-like [Lolium perenne]|uniref:strigolactone esterase D14-like n=1 Tax=Lolium perenne TaxID=4522 RepID=UPI0021EB2A7E
MGGASEATAQCECGGPQQQQLAPCVRVRREEEDGWRWRSERREAAPDPERARGGQRRAPSAAIRRPDLFAKLVLIGCSPRFLNDSDYHGGFELEEIQQVFDAMSANYAAWATGYAPLAVGADVPAAVQFSRTLFNMRPDISLHVCQSVFKTDLRGVLGMVQAPCVVVQTTRDVSVPASVAAYLKAHLGGRTTIEPLATEGHLPHLSAPSLLAQVLRRALARF